MAELNELILSPSNDGARYTVGIDYYYKAGEITIRVPKGFVTDLASVPRILWNILPPFGRYTKGAVVHDYLYSKYNDTGFDRKRSDKIFLAIMEEEGVSLIKRRLMYRGVRIFGGINWKEKC